MSISKNVRDSLFPLGKNKPSITLFAALVALFSCFLYLLLAIKFIPIKVAAWFTKPNLLSQAYLTSYKLSVPNL